MQFMLLIQGDEAYLPDTAGTGPIGPEYKAYTEAMQKAGVWITGDRLKTTHHAARVRVRDGKSVVLDGPYVDAKEQVGGYYIIDVPTMSDAIDWAARCPAAPFGTIEVRPFAEVPR